MATILVVDDSPVVKKIIVTTLTKSGYQVQEAKNGQEALDYLLNNRIDLLITDLNMPQMDGITLIKEIRKNPYLKRLPIIMLTTDTKEEQKALESGANMYLTKPVTSSALIENVKKLIC